LRKYKDDKNEKEYRIMYSKISSMIKDRCVVEFLNSISYVDWYVLAMCLK